MKQCRCWFLLGFFCLLVFVGFWVNSRYEVPVLMYHEVADRVDPPLDTVTPQVFRQQLKFLHDYGFKVISLERLVEIIARGEPLPRKTVVLTADDGYENNFTQLFPIWQEYRFPLTIFISPNFDRKKGFLKWPQILAMQQAGIVFGSHGMVQAYLPGLTEEEQRVEMGESKRLLEERLGQPVKFYAYPIGGFSHQIKELARQAGYQAAVATNRGYVRHAHDPYEIRRIRLSDKDRPGFIFGVKLSGFYNVLRKLKKPDGAYPSCKKQAAHNDIKTYRDSSLESNISNSQ